MKRAFTLVELILVLAIGGILLSISTNWYITNVAMSNTKNNRQVDLQSGVRTSMDMVRNTLKNATQVHLVGKNVYDPDLKLHELKTKNLDKNYNYIALSKDEDGNYSLVNIIYNNTKKDFESLPITAQVRNDKLSKSKVSYDMKLYQNDINYKEKLNKNLINISISGNVHDVDDAGNHIHPENDVVFELSEDIDLQNANQILISKYMSGTIADVTAIAYDNVKIETESGAQVKRMSFVFSIDDSNSMRASIGENHGAPEKPLKKTILLKAMIDFLKKIDDLGRDGNIAVDAYIYTWGDKTLYEILSGVPGGDPKKKYIYPIEKLEKKTYGPYKLGKGVTSYNNLNNLLSDSEKNTLRPYFNSSDWDQLIHTDVPDLALKHLKDNCKLTDISHYAGGTNTGLALLQGYEILNQLKQKKFSGTSEPLYNKQFFVFFTDGNPYQILMRPTTLHIHPNHDFTSDRPTIVSYPPDPKYEDYYCMFKGMITDAKDFYDKQGGYTYHFPAPNQHSYWENSPELEYKFVLKSEFALLYTKKICANKKLNAKNNFDKAYLVGLAEHPMEINQLGVSGIDSYINYTQLENTSKPHNKWPFKIGQANEYGSVRKYMSQNNKEDILEYFYAKDGTSLNESFENIIESIGNVMKAFDGPTLLTGY